MQNRCDKFQWMLDETTPRSANQRDDYSPPYGDVTALNRCRLIMDSVGTETLREIGKNAINLLETSVSIYEANGDYAFGMFSSGWCRLMDAASHELCNTDDNRTALSCGKWLCHENCWHDSAKQAIETGKSTDITCVGGIHLYAEPIYAGQRVVGAINVGYGDPPKSLDKLNALADTFDVDPETLKEIGDSYKSRPEFLVDATKKLLGSFAKLIGEIVKKVEIQREQKKIQLRELYLHNVLKAIRSVDQLIIKENDPSRLIQKACEELIDTMGYYNAWIVLLDEHSRNMTLTGSAGFNGNSKELQKTLNQGSLPSCVQRALEKRELIVINDPKNTCTDCPLSRHYHGRSALTHRLGNFGILSVSVPAHFAHDREEQDLFVEVANDLAFALSKIEAEKRIHIKKHIIQTIPHPISLVSRSYRYLAVNKAYSRIYNETPDKITGRRITDFIDPEVFEQDIKPHLDRCLKGETVQYETLVDFPVIGNRWMRMEYTPFRDKDHQIVGVVSHGLDITERKHMEEQLRHAHKMEAIGTLAGGIAHEFNNMLGIIIGNTELALDDIPAWNPAADYIQEVKAASLRAKDVVRKLLSVARKTPESRKPIQIGSVIKDALDLMRRTIPATIDIRTNITCSSEMILGDITEINQIVINLCTNSVHAMAEESGILEVGLDTRQMNRASLFYDEDLKPGDYVRLTVTDTGTGIDPAYMDRLYDPYFTTKDVDQGLGMGLAVVHGIVKKYDGAIKIESDVGRGTTVQVLFPLIEAQMEPKTEKSQTLQKGKERILLVDDEPSIVRMITQMLTRCGYEVIGKTSSASALNVFKDAPEQFDLVISDLTMPEISGDQLAQEIKQIRPGMPIILCTGHSNRMDENKAKELGIDAFIIKPFSRKNITEAIPKVLHKTNSDCCTNGYARPG